MEKAQPFAAAADDYLSSGEKGVCVCVCHMNTTKTPNKAWARIGTQHLMLNNKHCTANGLLVLRQMINSVVLFTRFVFVVVCVWCTHPPPPGRHGKRLHLHIDLTAI